MIEYPVRKRLRLKNYDYSQSGCYFVTLCSQDRKSIFGCIDSSVDTAVECNLSELGHVIQEQWLLLEDRFLGICVTPFCIMPNHVHSILTLPSRTWSEGISQQEQVADDGRQGQSPCPTTVGNVVGAFKSITTKKFNQLHGGRGKTLWQSRFHDHVIRNEQEYGMVYQYIEQNAAKWREDRYHADENAADHMYVLFRE